MEENIVRMKFICPTVDEIYSHINVGIMTVFQASWILLLTTLCVPQTSLACREIIGVLDEATELTGAEIFILTPLFKEIQLQYDFIQKQPQREQQMDEHFLELYQSTIREFYKNFGPELQFEPTIVYNTTFPTLDELIGDIANFEQMSPEEINDYLDMRSIFQDTLDEAQESIDALVARALQVESELLKFNKPKIMMKIFKALGFMFKASARLGRAAYCTYSYIPHLNESLHHLNDGVDCYLGATSIIVKIQNEVYQTVQIVRKSILDLASIYKKVAEKNSIVAKAVSLMRNSMNILRNILRTLRQANHVIDEAVHKLPGAILDEKNCARNFVNGMPNVVQSVTNTTTCIMFADNSTKDYDWMEPENSTRIPEIIADPQSGETDGSFEMP